MSDTFNVTAGFDKPSYNQGETIKVTISGNDVHTEETTVQVGPLTLNLTAADGATSTLEVPSTTATMTTTTIESVRITGVQDTGPNPRAWTIDPSGLFVTAVA